MRQYRSRLHAACAADLGQLALGHATVNLPGWTIHIYMTGLSQKFQMSFADPAAAACAADLAHMAMEEGPRRQRMRFNFPLDIYSWQQVAAVAALIAARYPGAVLSPAGMAGSGSSIDAATSSSNNSSSSSSSSSSSIRESGAGGNSGRDEEQQQQQQQQQQLHQQRRRRRRAHSQDVVAAAALLL
ncbi:hypothetical protein OEZ85_012858 [Tetradesmus obliquus]|uniref:Uncharacterized protein n=1 Tax=Tetradesmus obliquus TaxID=3088 RepID=A0ABY8U6V9_TETOB|nr:hypothetical protein OEZ85_012858 [Tetradesmus obliquus]